jgi:hypothetical protein
MALPEFVESVRIAAGFLSPEVWTDSRNQPPDEMARSMQLADIWLTPAAVKGFSKEDFVSLPPDERDRLAEAVDQFRAVARQVGPHGPATAQQVNDALPQFLTILETLRPYIADPEAIEVRRAIWQACWTYRDWILSFDFQLGEDSAGEPAVRVWLIIDKGVDVLSRKVQLDLRKVRDDIRAKLREAGIRRDLYTSVWGRWEVAPVVLGGARG